MGEITMSLKPKKPKRKTSKRKVQHKTKEHVPTIRFSNVREAVLYAAELKGQISDGAWENSRPYDHWKIMSDAEVKIDKSNPGLNFRPKRKYNFGNTELVDIVGDRMRMYVAIAENHPHLVDTMLSGGLAADFSLGSTPDKMIEYSHRTGTSGEYWKNNLLKAKKQYGASTNDELRQVYKDLTSWLDSHYSTKELKKDLRHMSSIVNTRE